MPRALLAVERAAFVSDVHLSAGDPATLDLFERFIARLGSLAPAVLFILGDLFEYWAGDDDGDAALHQYVASLLHAQASDGLALYFIAGNRDFLLGADYAQRCSMTLLPDDTCIEVGGREIIISHGDALCTDDSAYQEFRARVRSTDWQADFLARPLAERLALIGAMRDASESAKRNKAENIMDVNAQAVAALFESGDADLLIHGHTHRPARHGLLIAGRHCQRWVLPDWSAHVVPPRGGGLFADSLGVHRIELG